MYNYKDHENLVYENEEPPVYTPSGETVYIIRTQNIHQTDNEEDMSVYSQQILDLVADQSRAGIPEQTNAISTAGVSKHGERSIQMFLVIDPETKIIKQAGYRCRGDIGVIASASLIASKVEGLHITDALKITGEELRDELGKMPSDRITRPFIAVCALKGAIGDFYIRQNISYDDLEHKVTCDPYSVSCIMCQHCAFREQRYKLQFKKLGIVK